MTKLKLAELALSIILIAVVAYVVISAFMPFDKPKAGTTTWYYTVNDTDPVVHKRIKRGWQCILEDGRVADPIPVPGEENVVACPEPADHLWSPGGYKH